MANGYVWILSDAYTRREKASEDLYMKQKEKEKSALDPTFPKFTLYHP